MLVRTRELLAIAEARNGAVAAFNVTGLETIQAALGAAETLGDPVIIEFATAHEEDRVATLDVMGPVMVTMAERSSVPVAVHLDHGVSIDYIKRALDMGFTSVMYDGSALPFEQNVANTRLAREVADQYGATLEAELGKMAGLTLNNEGVIEDRPISRRNFTDPGEAAEFVRLTEIDCLACSFGTSHGLYKEPPNLDFELAREIRQKAGVPLVMHGSSGVADEDYGPAIDAGVRKINYYTYMAKAGGEAVRNWLPSDGILFFHDLANVGRKAMEENALRAMRLFRNDGRI